MTSDSEREQQLRRLLAEAVEPVEPGPGAETRLLARARSQAQRKRRHRADVLRWAVPVTIVSLAVVFLATVGVIAARNGGDGGSKGSSTAAGGAGSISAPDVPSDTAAAPAGPSRSPSGTNAAPAVPGPSALSNHKEASAASSGASQFSSNDLRASALLPSDLDGDGRTDTFAIERGKLIATLSTDGVQSVELPPTGTGARVLDVVALSDPSRNTVPALFVRLQQSGTSFTDTVVVLVSGRLTVLEKGSQPLQLRVDTAHGYGCDQRALAVSGDGTPYVVEGAQLVASPELRAVLVPVGKSNGC